ncbi:MAG TPA: DUF87 domain-containing protein [Patescibacteria group bacterium]|nr:DUF87 domain-containing protein [Patescibacteria group bacterium]
MILGKRQASTPDTGGTVLLLQVPRTNEKKELAAEQMFASLHGLLLSNKARFKSADREHLSFEIAVQHKRIGFFVWVPNYLKSFVEEQVYAQYPNVEISEIEDYTLAKDVPTTTQLTAELHFTANEALPIKTFPSFEVDPLASITATLAQFDDNEEAWLQVVIRPAQDKWYKKSEQYAAGIRVGRTSNGILKALWAPPASKTESVKLAEHESAKATAAEAKSHKLAYEVALRIVYRGNTSPAQARMRIQAITASFKQFNTTYLNGFSGHILGEDNRFIELYRSRQITKRGFICNIEEVASLYHLPHTNVETPNILWANAKTAEPPANLPIIGENNRDVVSPIAATNFRGHNTMFGMPREDRGRHLYIIGQTGTGKSALLELLTISDMYSPYGFAVIDPHGDYALNVLKRIPQERAKDVIYFNPADTDFPIAFNPMEVYDPKLKTHTATELIGVLKRMFESWGPRLEYILRYSLLALLDYPNATMLDITRILTDKKFRSEVLEYVEDPVVRNFWLVEFASWNDKFATEAVAPVLNKVGAFTANPTVRNIIGQPKSSFNIRTIMDERKILIVNLSRGLVGEDNAALLGALLVTKIQMAAMSRADIPPEERTPFYLYVDEFQNFATDSFATILSEARKYALNLTVANQYIAQMMQSVKDAVFGNVGSIITFRTSADDARTMLKYFEPKFEEHDLVHMHNRHFAISMTIDGEKVQAFSATTLNLPERTTDFSEEIIARSREQFAFNRSEIEAFMHERYVSPSREATKHKPVAPPAIEQTVQQDRFGIPKPENVNYENQAEPNKRKRSRRRRRHPVEQSSSQSSSMSDDETVIHLR